MERFNYITYVDGKSRNVVVCIGYYKGKAVRGVAKCATEDTFNIYAGKELARARCEMKIAEKRLANAEAKLAGFRAELHRLEVLTVSAEEYKHNATEIYKHCKKALATVESSLNK